MVVICIISAEKFSPKVERMLIKRALIRKASLPVQRSRELTVCLKKVDLISINIGDI